MQFIVALAALLGVASALPQVSETQCTMAKDYLSRRCPFGKSYYYGAQLRKGQAVTAVRYFYAKNDGDAWVLLDDASIPTDNGPTWVRYSSLKGCSGGYFNNMQTQCPPGTSP
ncbi:hypothetical protein Slin15195_G085350 [Septoria linicola]|uniref:Uncharacterized protein n=1 Tax=Septoria linicola TaxID=215465 RepID=A0A9Q9EKW2_9PEZI|nr:hypothetical protein Slin15195_G085350 [Septoria linicola]